MTKCAKCDRPVGDAFCCTECAREARKHLATIAYLTAHADEKRARVGSNMLTGGAGKAAETAIPFDPRVSKVLHPILVSLHGTGRAIVEEHQPNLMDPLGYGEDLGYVDPRMDRLKPKSLPSIANWLRGFTDWIRHQQYAAEEFNAFERAARNTAALFDRPPDKLFMGTCEALDEDGSGIECGEWLYVEVNTKGEPDSQAINCPRCKAVHQVSEHRTDILARLADYHATLKEISSMCRSMVDGDVSVRMLQIYAKHGFLMQRGSRLEVNSRGQHRKVATYRIGDVEPAVDLWKNYLSEHRDKKKRRRTAA